MRNWNEKLFLGTLPSTEEELDAFLHDLEINEISWIVNLTSDDQMDRRSPEFAQWRAAQSSFEFCQVPLSEGGVPTTRSEIELFWVTALDVGEWVETEQQRVFLHCADGIGRIGTFAVAAFTFQLGRPNKGCTLNHLDGETGYIALQDAMSETYRVFDYATDELLGSYPDPATLVDSGWKVST